MGGLSMRLLSRRRCERLAPVVVGLAAVWTACPCRRWVSGGVRGSSVLLLSWRRRGRTVLIVVGSAAALAARLRLHWDSGGAGVSSKSSPGRWRLGHVVHTIAEPVRV